MGGGRDSETASKRIAVSALVVKAKGGNKPG